MQTLASPRLPHQLHSQRPAWFMGYKDVIVIGLQTNPVAIEIVNQQIADSFHSYFTQFWNESKPANSLVPKKGQNTKTG